MNEKKADKKMFANHVIHCFQSMIDSFIALLFIHNFCLKLKHFLQRIELRFDCVLKILIIKIWINRIRFDKHSDKRTIWSLKVNSLKLWSIDWMNRRIACIWNSFHSKQWSKIRVSFGQYFSNYFIMICPLLWTDSPFLQQWRRRRRQNWDGFLCVRKILWYESSH